jgi:hypothetical protein
MYHSFLYKQAKVDIGAIFGKVKNKLQEKVKPENVGKAWETFQKGVSTDKPFSEVFASAIDQVIPGSKSVTTSIADAFHENFGNKKNLSKTVNRVKDGLETVKNTAESFSDWLSSQKTYVKPKKRGRAKKVVTEAVEPKTEKGLSTKALLGYGAAGLGGSLLGMGVHSALFSDPYESGSRDRYKYAEYGYVDDMYPPPVDSEPYYNSPPVATNRGNPYLTGFLGGGLAVGGAYGARKLWNKMTKKPKADTPAESATKKVVEKAEQKPKSVKEMADEVLGTAPVGKVAPTSAGAFAPDETVRMPRKQKKLAPKPYKKKKTPGVKTQKVVGDTAKKTKGNAVKKLVNETPDIALGILKAVR